MIPFTNAAAQVLARETARSIRRERRKRLERRSTHGKDVAIGSEPITFPACTLLVLLSEPVVKHLDLDTGLRQGVGLQIFQCLVRHPHKNTGVAARTHVPPLDDEFEVGKLLPGTHHPNRLT
jgi:hypothetical protein